MAFPSRCASARPARPAEQAHRRQCRGGRHATVVHAGIRRGRPRPPASPARPPAARSQAGREGISVGRRHLRVPNFSSAARVASRAPSASMSSSDTSMMRQPEMKPALARWNRPNSSLRRDRSLVAPDSTNTLRKRGPTPGERRPRCNCSHREEGPGACTDRAARSSSDSDSDSDSDADSGFRFCLDSASASPTSGLLSALAAASTTGRRHRHRHWHQPVGWPTAGADSRQIECKTRPAQTGDATGRRRLESPLRPVRPRIGASANNGAFIDEVTSCTTPP